MITDENDQAEQCFRQAIRLEPSEAQAYHNIARLRFDGYRLDEAIEYANKALSYDPKLKEALALLSIIYYKQGIESEAEKYFHMALAAGENETDLRRAIKRYSSLSREDWSKEEE